MAQPAPEAASLAIEFGQMTADQGLTRRQAIAKLSRKYGLRANDLYAQLEGAKNSGG
jgi:hypothetical protein